jgi:hypothetical protein
MSELNNPLFDDQKEFLERQKQEYKNALLNDVSELKNKSQQIGKTVLIAGGALAGIWMISSLFRGKKKAPKRLKGRNTPLLLNPPPYRPANEVVQPDGSLDYSNALHQDAAHGQSTGQYANQYSTGTQQPSDGGGILHSLLQSDMAKALTQQVTAFLLVYLSKKAEEFLNMPKNNDIAASREPETKDIDFSYHEEDAV